MFFSLKSAFHPSMTDFSSKPCKKAKPSDRSSISIGCAKWRNWKVISMQQYADCHTHCGISRFRVPAEVPPEEADDTGGWEAVCRWRDAGGGDWKLLRLFNDLLCCMIANPISFFLAHKKNRSFAALDEKGKVIWHLLLYKKQCIKLNELLLYT